MRSEHEGNNISVHKSTVFENRIKKFERLRISLKEAVEQFKHFRDDG